MCIISFHIKDDELCPCGSGSPFASCCKTRQSKQVTSRKPPEVLIMEKMRSLVKRNSFCLHPDSSKCKGPIKKAHALQNNKIISLLAGADRHVYMLDSQRQPLLLPMDDGSILPFAQVEKISANDATTQTCFCDFHDNVAFAAIEKGAPDFDPSNEEMKFVYAYKAFIFEYYKKLVGKMAYQESFKSNPEAFLDRNSVGLYRSQQLELKEFERIKEYFDEQILSGTHDGVYTQVVKIPKQIKFACFAYIAPNYDLNGRRINHTIKGVMHRIAITAFPEKTCSWVLFSCLDDEKEYYSEFFSQLNSSPLDKIQFYLTMILPLFSENMVLSPELWKKWDVTSQFAYTHMANLFGPDALNLETAIGMALKNASRDKSGKAYSNPVKIDLFV